MDTVPPIQSRSSRSRSRHQRQQGFAAAPRLHGVLALVAMIGAACTSGPVVTPTAPTADTPPALIASATVVPGTQLPHVPSPTTPAPLTPPPSTAIQIPVSQLTPLDECLIEAGFVPLKTRPPDDPLNAQNRVVLWRYDGTVADGVQMRAKRKACDERYGVPDRELTEDEIRARYVRWVAERDCLVELGYHPVEPPSVETFLASWATGPWMPIDGVPVDNWSDAEFREAKERCTIEMYDQD